LHIVLVEDDADTREALLVLLSSEGHKVVTAADGPGGLELVLDAVPEVALVDIGLPGFDGYELARRLRRTSGGEHVYLVAVTGWGRPEDRSAAEAAGFDAVILKPFGMARLDEALRSARTRMRGAATRPADTSGDGVH
jgi:DNA-binding response OmpR family regulator